jgi:DNA polymerase mu
MKLQDLGEKVAQRIDEFLTTGRIEESQVILASPRYQALRTFSSVHTIGYATAKELYDRHHCRTLEDVRLHYANIAEESEEVRLKVKDRRRREGGMLHVDIVEEWIKIKDDLDEKWGYHWWAYG